MSHSHFPSSRVWNVFRTGATLEDLASNVSADVAVTFPDEADCTFVFSTPASSNDTKTLKGLPNTRFFSDFQNSVEKRTTLTAIFLLWHSLPVLCLNQLSTLTNERFDEIKDHI